MCQARNKQSSYNADILRFQQVSKQEGSMMVDPVTFGAGVAVAGAAQKAANNWKLCPSNVEEGFYRI